MTISGFGSSSLIVNLYDFFPFALAFIHCLMCVLAIAAPALRALRLALAMSSSRRKISTSDLVASPLIAFFRFFLASFLLN